MSAINLYSGAVLDLLNPDPNAFTIVDIAHALGQICRFNGHTKTFYSVAQHCVLCSKIVPEEHMLGALLHDAQEAFTGDMMTPLKALIPEFKAIEINLEKVVLAKFGLDFPLHPCIKEADIILLATEKRDLLKESTNEWPMLKGVVPLTKVIRPMSPPEATYSFLFRFAELTGKNYA